MLKPLFSLLSPAGARARLSTLIFHRVLPQADPMFPDIVDAARFDTLCGWLRQWFNVLPLDDAIDRLGRGALPARPLAVTFDDGYADNHDVAMPILRRHGLSATFFVSTAFVDGGRMWNDTVIETLRRAAGPTLDLSAMPGLGCHPLADAAARRRAIDTLIGQVKYLPPVQRQAVVDEIAARAGVLLPADLMLSSAQLRGLRQGGMGVGAHTVTHPILAKLDRGAAQAEIEGGKRALEALLGEPVSLFAYPNGKPGEDYTDEAVALVKAAGFSAAVSTHWGVAQAGSDRFQLPRFTPWDTGRGRFGLRMLSNLRHPR